MNIGISRPARKSASKPVSVLLMDANPERLALRKRVMAMHGVDIIGAGDLVEASSIWHRDRYDMVLMDIRRDHNGCLAWRDQIRKEAPRQLVAFLVGRPAYIDLEPLVDSYVSEAHGFHWEESMRRAVRESCEYLPQRHSFVEAGWRIVAARKMMGTLPKPSTADTSAPYPLEVVYESEVVSAMPAPATDNTEAQS